VFGLEKTNPATNFFLIVAGTPKKATQKEERAAAFAVALSCCNAAAIARQQNRRQLHQLIEMGRAGGNSVFQILQVTVCVMDSGVAQHLTIRDAPGTGALIHGAVGRVLTIGTGEDVASGVVIGAVVLSGTVVVQTVSIGVIWCSGDNVVIRAVIGCGRVLVICVDIFVVSAAGCQRKYQQNGEQQKREVFLHVVLLLLRG